MEESLTQPSPQYCHPPNLAAGSAGQRLDPPLTRAAEEPSGSEVMHQTEAEGWWRSQVPWSELWKTILPAE